MVLHKFYGIIETDSEARRIKDAKDWLNEGGLDTSRIEYELPMPRPHPDSHAIIQNDTSQPSLRDDVIFTNGSNNTEYLQWLHAFCTGTIFRGADIMEEAV